MTEAHQTLVEAPPEKKLRLAKLVAREVRDGIVSVEAAREIYGVAVDPETFQLDQAETERLRATE